MSWMNFSDQVLYRKLRGGSFFMRCVKPEIHDIQETKNKHYMLHANRLNQRNYYMLYVKKPNQRNCLF